MLMSTDVEQPTGIAGRLARPWRWLAAGAAVAIMALLSLVGCGGNDENSDRAHPVADADIDLVGPDEFAERMADPDALVINVHVPYEGEIAGTDLFVPFDEVTSSSRLPADHDQLLVIYCRTGNMSATAAAALVDAGYTDVTDLDGGMVAWDEAGHPIENVPDHAG
jgi:rhodanese-related sulfurtransferase